MPRCLEDEENCEDDDGVVIQTTVCNSESQAREGGDEVSREEDGGRKDRDGRWLWRGNLER